MNGFGTSVPSTRTQSAHQHRRNPTGCPRSVHHVREKRDVPCRLARAARTARHTPQESLPHESRRRPLREEDAKGGSEGKPAPYETAEAIARTWAKAGQPGDHLNIAAKALASELQGLKGRIPGAVVAAIPARWTKLAHATQFQRVKMLRKVCRDIDKQLHTSLEEGLPRMRPPEARMQIAASGTLEKLLAVAPPHLQLFIRLCAHTALRFGEAWGIAPENWNAEQNEIRLAVKGGSYRAWKADTHTADLLNAACQSTARPERLIARLYGAGLTKQALRRHFYKLCEIAGVDTNIRPHDLRRTAAVTLYEKTHDVLAVKKLLGHETLHATAHYLKPYDPERMRPLLRDERWPWTPRKGELPN